MFDLRSPRLPEHGANGESGYLAISHTKKLPKIVPIL